MKSILQNKTCLYLICLFLGIITSFSLPPYNFVFLNFLSLPTLLYILINYTHKKIISFFVGWVFGFGYFISNLYWITNSLTFDVNFKLIIPFALILIPLFLGIFYGLVTFLSSLFNLKNKLITKLQANNIYEKKSLEEIDFQNTIFIFNTPDQIIFIY